MPLWATVFKAIPWLDLIAAAPTAVRGARQLWTTIRQRPEEAGSPDPAAGPAERLEHLEGRLAELQRELAASSELLRQLAEQNERLVQTARILHARVRTLFLVCLVLGGLVAYAILNG